MYGRNLWTWGKNKMGSVREFVTKKAPQVIANTLSFTGKVFSALYTFTVDDFYPTVISGLDLFFYNPSIKNYLYGVFHQGLNTVLQPFNFKVWEKIFFRRSNSRRILLRLAYVNGALLSLVMLRTLARNNLINAASEEDASVSLSTLNQIDNMAYLSLWALSGHAIIQNAILLMALSKSLMEENPDVSAEFKACPEEKDPGTMLSADVDSILEYLFHLALLYPLTYVPYLRVAAIVVGMYISGRSIQELKLASVGNCTPHRIEQLRKLTVASVVTGAEVELMTFGACQVIQRYTGIPYTESRFRVQALLYPLFASATLLRNEPIQTFGAGTDFLTVTRKVERLLLDELKTWLSAYLKPPAKSDTKVAEVKPENLDGMNEEEKKDYLEKKKQQELYELKLKKYQMYLENLRVKAGAFWHVFSAVWGSLKKNTTKQREKVAENQYFHNLIAVPLTPLKILMTWWWHKIRFNVRDFEVSPEMTFLFDVYYDPTQAQLAKLYGLTNKAWYEKTGKEFATTLAAKIIPVFPDSWTNWLKVSPESKRLMELLFDKKIQQPLEKTISELARIRDAQTNKIKVDPQAKSRVVVDEQYECPEVTVEGLKKDEIPQLKVKTKAEINPSNILADEDDKKAIEPNNILGLYSFGQFAAQAKKVDLKLIDDYDGKPSASSPASVPARALMRAAIP